MQRNLSVRMIAFFTYGQMFFNYLLTMRIYLLKKFVLKGLSEATKETPISISTPLMEFVRQKRADKGGNKGSAVVKGGKRAGSASPTNSGSSNTKRGSGKNKETEGMLQQAILASNVGSSAYTAAKQYQRHEASGRLIKSILPSTTAWALKKFQNLDI
ncbi:hypothetical protein NC651_030534 [Populus alba x Populus x berolinensis]|nr:hypothetical protein NC651_030534 [Populus alba x Populus x berolinensis]